MNYWNVGEYLGLGLNSSSALIKDGKLTRFSNAQTMEEYLSDIGKDSLPRRDEQVIDVSEEMFEWAMLGLRKIEGVDKKAFVKRFGTDFAIVFSRAVNTLENMGWLTQEEGHIHLTDRGLDMQNSALMEFMEQE